jgi:hypothetical protein
MAEVHDPALELIVFRSGAMGEVKPEYPRCYDEYVIVVAHREWKKINSNNAFFNRCRSTRAFLC